MTFITIIETKRIGGTLYYFTLTDEVENVCVLFVMQLGTAFQQHQS